MGSEEAGKTFDYYFAVKSFLNVLVYSPSRILISGETEIRLIN